MRYVSRLTLGGVLRWVSYLAIGGILSWYVAFQARAFIAGPSITLHSDATALRDTRTIIIEGVAQNVTAIMLNDRPIFTDDKGNFRERLVLENGYTIMTLRALDRYGREKVVTQSFVYTPAHTSPAQER